MKPIIYVAANGQEPTFVPEVSKVYDIIYPGYKYGNGLFSDAPKKANEFENALSLDFYGLSKSDVLIYDVDSDPGFHFLAFAFSLNKSIIAVSQCLNSPGPYWSLAIDFLVKPDQVLGHLKALIRNAEEGKIKTPQQADL